MIPSKALRQARRRAGLTQRELASRTHVPQSTIARIEAADVDPRFATLDKLLRACGEELDVVGRRGDGVDRTLLAENLTRNPEARLRSGYETALRHELAYGPRRG